MSLISGLRPFSRNKKFSIGGKNLTLGRTTWVNLDNPRVGRDLARHGSIGTTFPAGVPFYQNDDGVVTAGGRVEVRETGLVVDVSATRYTRDNGTDGSADEGTATIGAADATNPRVDAVVVNTTNGTYAVIAGTASAGANEVTLAGKPNLPANRIALAYVIVPNGATNLSQENVIDVRP